VLQKEHKKEFEAYLTKQFKHPEQSVEQPQKLRLDGEERTPVKVLQSLKQGHVVERKHRQKLKEFVDESIFIKRNRNSSQHYTQEVAGTSKLLVEAEKAELNP